MRLSSRHYTQGSVALMTLCFLAALGIGLAGYLAVAKQAMTLSNRAYQGPVSRQLAEMGLERALWSLNRNDWTNWTLNGTTATRTISFPVSKYGAIGTAGTIKLRIDNYNAFVQDAAWNSAEDYSVGEAVGYGGTWYRCVVGNTNKTPSANSIYWIPDQSKISFNWRTGADYTSGNVAYSNGDWYRCVGDHTSIKANLPLSSNGNWVRIPYLSQDPSLYYTNNAVVNWYGTWYQYQTYPYNNWDNNPPITWRWRASPSVAYVKGDIVCYNNVWYACTSAHNSSYSIYPTNTSYWKSAATSTTESGTASAWSSGISYNLDDITYRSGSWYRCIRAHTGQQPPNATYWSLHPRRTVNWVAGKTYPTNSAVYYQGTWYRNTSGTNNTPPASPWRSAASDTPWNASTYYANGSYASYGNVWYKCISGHTNQTPNNSTYWAAQGAPVIYAEGQASMTNGNTIKTQLRAVAAKAPLFPNIAAAQTLTFGTGATVDSYDASTTTYSSGTATDEAVLAGSNSSGTALALSSATVKGFAAAPSSGTSPYAPLVSYANSASLTNSGGSVSYPSGSAASVDLARISRSPYIPLFDIHPVADLNLVDTTTKPLGTPGAVIPTSYNHYDGSSYQIRLNSSRPTLIIEGPTILHADSNLRIESGGQIIIKPTGSLVVIVDRDLRVEATSGGIDNQTLDPKKCIILLGRTGTDTFYYKSTTPFYGVIYLPGSSSTFDVGDGVEIYGAIYAQNLTFGNNVKLHYDTSLRTSEIPGVDAPCIISDWRELASAEERASW